MLTPTKSGAQKAIDLMILYSMDVKLTGFNGVKMLRLFSPIIFGNLNPVSGDTSC